jgi:hypothetical protein
MADLYVMTDDKKHIVRIDQLMNSLSIQKAVDVEWNLLYLRDYDSLAVKLSSYNSRENAESALRIVMAELIGCVNTGQSRVLELYNDEEQNELGALADVWMV